MINITKNTIKFNDLEEKMWKKKMQEGLEELRDQLQRIDNQLLKDKDNEELEVKDFQKTTIKCKFGDLEFYRRRYKLRKNGKTKMVYLLDIYLELGYSGQYSQSIVELVLKEATEKSYRKTAETIRETTNVSITHTAARRILIDFSKKHIEKIEKEKLKLYEKGLLRYQYDLGLSKEEIEKLDETEYRNLGTEESQMYCGCRKRMKKNRTSWCDEGAEAMVKVISYIKSNLLDDLITGRMEDSIQEELSERVKEPGKIKKIKLGKIKYATQNSILESLTGFKKLRVKDLLRNKGFNEMRIIGD